MTFEELGIVLRTEREKQKLDIEDVAHRLKISARVLRALESADTTSLPHSVYVRGFVISYAKLLDIDTAELLTVAELYDENEDPSKSETYYYSPKAPFFTLSKVLFLLFLCVCLAVGGFIWLNRDADLFSQIKKDHLTTAQPAPPIEEEKPQVAEVKNGEVKESSIANNQETTVEESVQEQSTTSQEESVDTESTTTVSENETSVEAQEAVQEEEVTPHEGPHKIIITAVAECWVHSNADDGDTRQFSLRTGDTFALTFTESLSLKLGNAGGVRIRYNGKDLPAPGLDGEVKTLTFPPR